jgi:hypothetical protein
MKDDAGGRREQAVAEHGKERVNFDKRVCGSRARETGVM